MFEAGIAPPWLLALIPGIADVVVRRWRIMAHDAVRDGDMMTTAEVSSRRYSSTWLLCLWLGLLLVLVVANVAKGGF